MVMTQSERQIAGENIRKLREEAGTTQTEFARDVDIERTYFIDIENGAANVTFEKYERIAAALGVKVRDLLEPSRKRKAS